MRLVCWPVWSAGSTGSVLGFGESGSDAFGSLGRRGWVGQLRRRLRSGGGIGWSLLRAEFAREWAREQQEWQEKNQLSQNLVPPSIIVPHHGDKFPGFLCRTAIAVGFRMRPGRCIYGTRGIVTAAAHSTERILSSRSIVCVAADFYEAQSFMRGAGVVTVLVVGGAMWRLRPRRF